MRSRFQGIAVHLFTVIPALVSSMSVIACAAPASGPGPYCGAQGPLPETSHDCRASTVFYQQKLVDAIDPMLRSEHFGSLVISAEFDRSSSVASVCVDPGSEPARWVVRQQVASCNEALRRFAPAPACLSGTRLDVTDALFTASESSGQRRPPDIELETDGYVPTMH